MLVPVLWGIERPRKNWLFFKQTGNSYNRHCSLFCGHEPIAVVLEAVGRLLGVHRLRPRAVFLASAHDGRGAFGYHKGWFVYTPLMLLAIGGLFVLKKKALKASWPS
ncbi:MAG: hypothetical protein R3B47_12240 [Bacteroidia bacterium]